MPTNQREEILFTMLMCFFMALFMTIYNVATMHQQFNLDVLATAWINFPLSYIVALSIEIIIVGRLAPYLAFKLVVSYTSPKWLKIIAISLFTIAMMVVSMSLFGTILNLLQQQNWSNFWQDWGHTILKNLIFAVPLQLILVGPMVRKMFRTAFPVGAVR